MNKLTKQAEAVSEILTELAKAAEVGVMTIELDNLAAELLKKYNARSYNLDYQPSWAPSPYPAIICASVNDCIGHGIPSAYKLQDGDLLNLDLGIVIDRLCGDAGFTIPIGELSSRDERLLRYARRAVYAGAGVIKAGVTPWEIGRAIEGYAKTMGFVVNHPFTGHGIGAEMHMAPSIPHFDPPPEAQEVLKNFPLKAGDVVCLEPMLTYKDEYGYIAGDGWARKTKDGRKSAMFEHMIEVLDGGYNILTTHFEREHKYA